MMPDRYDALIVGAGHAGAQAAIALRQRKFVGSIALIGDEPDLPYERPPLSKDYLAGQRAFDRILLRPATFWDDRLITLRLGESVSAVDADAYCVQLAQGETIGYGALIWAAGGSARRLTCQGHDLAGVHSVRTRGDVDVLSAELPTVERVVVVGGGYIGLEAAAVLTKLGKRVILLEALDRVLARVAGETLSRFYEDEHRAHGVEIRLNAAVTSILGTAGRVTGVRLQDGVVLECDMVIVGIGIVPNVDPLARAGARIDNGVHVDGSCRTTLDGVYAIGDCAAHVNEYAGGGTIRLESVQNANDQATVVARTIMGEDVVYSSAPWFWSNQYDLRLQTVGLSTGFDRCVLRGKPVSRSFSLIYLREGRVIALDCVNATKDYVQGKVLVETKAVIDPSTLEDDSKPLKHMAQG